MPVLSVDLGTSNTVAVLSAHGRPPSVLELDGSVTMPSAVFADQDGTLVVGREAVRRARTDPSRFEPNPKRRIDEGTLLLGDRVVPVTEALSAVLGRVNAEVTRQLGGAAPDEVRLTHPAQWGPVRRNALLSAARQAGMPHNLMLIPEPVAAAAHFASFPGHALPQGKALVVYDLGAGTFDVGIVAAQQEGFAVLAEAGLPDFGGVDVDHALLTHLGRQVAGRDPAAWQRLLRPESIVDRRAVRLLQEDVRAAKEALSAHPQTEVALPSPFGDALVTRAEMEALIRPKLAESVQLLAATMTSAGLTPANLAGVYLVGGSSRIPLVATLIAEQLRIVPTGLDSPETSVALGAHLLPRAGMTMRTDTQPPPPRPQPGQPMQPTAPRPAVSEPPPKRRRRTLVLVAAAVLAVVVGVVVVLRPWGGSAPAQPAAMPPVKYEGADLPTCSTVTATIEGADLEKAVENRSPNAGQGATIDCDLTIGSGGRVLVDVQLYPANSYARPGAEYANDIFDQDSGGNAVNLGYGEKAANPYPAAECTQVKILLLDDNALFRITYTDLADNAVPADCLQSVKDITKGVYDASQPE